MQLNLHKHFDIFCSFAVTLGVVQKGSLAMIYFEKLVNYSFWREDSLHSRFILVVTKGKPALELKNKQPPSCIEIQKSVLEAWSIFLPGLRSIKCWLIFLFLWNSQLENYKLANDFEVKSGQISLIAKYSQLIFLCLITNCTFSWLVFVRGRGCKET